VFINSEDILTGLPGTGKTAVAERINGGVAGSDLDPYAVEIDGHHSRFRSHCHIEPRMMRYRRSMTGVGSDPTSSGGRGGELTLENTDLTWSDAAKFYEAPFQMKSKWRTLVLTLGRQRVPPQDLLNR